MTSDGFKSRKFWITVALSIKNTILLTTGVITPEIWAPLEAAIILFFTSGNVVEKYAK